MAEPKIVFVGGGSVAWVPNIVRDVLLTPSLADGHVVLYDINKKASDLTAKFCTKLAGALGVGAKIESTNDAARALQGADYVVVTISTGGLDAMDHDIAIPEGYSIYQTVGDTSGPGGWARSIRNFDVFVELADLFNRHCPGALVLNYTNPMAVLTDVLCRLYDGPVVGLCHGLFENLAFLKSVYRVKSEEDLAVRYAGVNHFFWMTEVRVRGKDVIPDLAKKMRRSGGTLTPMFREAFKDSMGHRSDREVASELFELTGVLPYLGDRHTCEFFPWYITQKKTMKQYRLRRTSIDERRQMFRGAHDRLRKRLDGPIPDQFRKRTRETAADICDAHRRGRPFIDVGNVPNRGQIANLPPDAIVETAVRVDGNGFDPIAFGDLPDPIASWCDTYCRVYQMTADACFSGDRELAIRALRLDPTCAHLTTPRLREMAAALLKAHKRFITAF